MQSIKPLIKSFQPPYRLQMGPGPSAVSERVLTAMSKPTIGHLDPAFITVMDELKVLLQYAFQTTNRLTIPISGPGSAGMETCFVNLVEPGDQIIVCENGVFGKRMTEIVERCGGIPIVVKDAWGSAIDLQKLEDCLKKFSAAKIVAFVHAETSTGACSDARAIAALARRYECLTIMDAVTSLGGIPVCIDAWGIDAAYSGSQKCLSAPPGLSPITLNERAIAKIKSRQYKVQSWFLDLNLIMQHWESKDNKERVYHHTAPINALYGLHEALLALQEEGLEQAWERHQNHYRLMCHGVQALDLNLFVRDEAQLPQLCVVKVPQGMNEKAIRLQLLNEFGLEIGAGLGELAGLIWRIGLMGYSSQKNNISQCLAALKSVMS